jgi:hypothetical protein
MYGKGLGGSAVTVGTTTGGLAATGVPILTTLALAALLVISGLALLSWGRSRYVD